ncbi:hypothetical protein IV203_016705 [Nitzschia inconspicua]|uniref:Uncharacterized protein n=1 Tax=Nitzschia inconspicua TaxID=303405 RepID=A0A9K3KRN5_9STRA|nr:hypothetical protein IV203_016705 [Nitzschia inconspicua]
MNIPKRHPSLKIDTTPLSAAAKNLSEKWPTSSVAATANSRAASHYETEKKPLPGRLKLPPSAEFPRQRSSFRQRRISMEMKATKSGDPSRLNYRQRMSPAEKVKERVERAKAATREQQKQQEHHQEEKTNES